MPIRKNDTKCFEVSTTGSLLTTPEGHVRLHRHSMVRGKCSNIDRALHPKVNWAPGSYSRPSTMYQQKNLHHTNEGMQRHVRYVVYIHVYMSSTHEFRLRSTGQLVSQHLFVARDGPTVLRQKQSRRFIHLLWRGAGGDKRASLGIIYLTIG